MAVHLFDDFNMRPTQLLDQHFGVGLHPEDLFASLAIPSRHHHPMVARTPAYYRPWKLPTRDTGSIVTCDKDQFQVNLDVQHFTLQEITVKVVENSLVVEGKHEEKLDEHGYVSRQFQRRYVIPKDHNLDHVESKLSSDGVLTICVPKVEAIESKERKIQITHTGQPHKAIKPTEEKKEVKK